MTKLLLPVSILFLFLAGNANADDCQAACSFIEAATEENCEDGVEMISKIGDHCGEDATCIIDATVEASEFEWSAEAAESFYTELFEFDCELD